MPEEESLILQNGRIKIDKESQQKIVDFLKSVKIFENNIKRPLLILYDAKSKAFYTECHIYTEEMNYPTASGWGFRLSYYVRKP